MNKEVKMEYLTIKELILASEGQLVSKCNEETEDKYEPLPCLCCFGSSSPIHQ